MAEVETFTGSRKRNLLLLWFNICWRRFGGTACSRPFGAVAAGDDDWQAALQKQRNRHGADTSFE